MEFLKLIILVILFIFLNFSIFVLNLFFGSVSGKLIVISGKSVSGLSLINMDKIKGFFEFDIIIDLKVMRDIRLLMERLKVDMEFFYWFLSVFWVLKLQIEVEAVVIR